MYDLSYSFCSYDTLEEELLESTASTEIVFIDIIASIINFLLSYLAS